MFRATSGEGEQDAGRCGGALTGPSVRVRGLCRSKGEPRTPVRGTHLAHKAMIRMLDHTADVGFEVVEAPTLEDLFDETRQASVAHDRVRGVPGEGRRRGLGVALGP